MVLVSGVGWWLFLGFAYFGFDCTSFTISPGCSCCLSVIQCTAWCMGGLRMVCLWRYDWFIG